MTENKNEKIVQLNHFKEEKNRSKLENIKSDILGQIVNVQFEKEEELYYITALVYDNRNKELSSLEEGNEEIMNAQYIIKFIEYFQIDEENDTYMEKPIDLTSEDYQKIYESIVQVMLKEEKEE